MAGTKAGRQEISTVIGCLRCNNGYELKNNTCQQIVKTTTNETLENAVYVMTKEENVAVKFTTQIGTENTILLNTTNSLSNVFQSPITENQIVRIIGTEKEIQNDMIEMKMTKTEQLSETNKKEMKVLVNRTKGLYQLSTELQSTIDLGYGILQVKYVSLQVNLNILQVNQFLPEKFFLKIIYLQNVDVLKNKITKRQKCRNKKVK